MSIVDKKLTKEIEKKLKSLRGYSPKSELTWTPNIYKENLPKTEWPLFKYKNRNAQDWADAEDEFLISANATDNFIKTNTANLRLFILRRQLTGWNNYKDKNGSLIEFKLGEDKLVHSDCINRMSKDLQTELLTAINDEDALTKEELEGLKF